jgi:hypothetical protein
MTQPIRRTAHLNCVAKALAIAIETDSIAITTMQRLYPDASVVSLVQERDAFTASLAINAQEIKLCPPQS